MTKLSRKPFTKQRRALSNANKRRLGNGATRLLNHLHLTRRCQHIGIYLDDFGELPTASLFQWCKRHGKKVYLPVVQGNQLQFRHIHTINKKRMVKHPLGMQQPRLGKPVSVKKLDVLFMPLVIADGQGNRTGMGGGFYDRTLAGCAKLSTTKKVLKKPLRIGWCYDFQVVHRLPNNDWDVPLHKLITPTNVYKF